MGAKFVVSHLDVQQGPFEESELKAKWVKGELLPIDYVYDDAKQDWLLVSERFAWATNKPEASSPPPLKDSLPRKARPPAPPKAIEISGASVVKEWKKEAGQGARVKMVDGIGEIDLSPLAPGSVEVVLQESSSGMLKLQNPLQINVKPSEPQSIEWTMPVSQAVGADTLIHIKALDAKGQLCAHFDDQFVIKVQASTNNEIKVPLSAGQASVKLQHTRAEVWKLSLHYTGSKTLKMPEDKSLDWTPGPAVRLILDGPQEYIAGSPLKVHVKAVDQYGNVAKTFQGTVILEVKAS